MVIVLGAGIAGLGAYAECRRRGIPVKAFERRRQWGGLCSGFEIDGYWFDNAIHLSFATGKAREFFDQTNTITHIPNPFNHYRGRWVKHPAQNNLFPLTPEEKTDLIAGFVENSRTGEAPSNYEDWLRIQFGACFSERFPLPYTRKYWRCEARELSVNWVTSRMYQPNLREVLLGAFSENTPITYYAKEMRYPSEGKYRTFLRPLVEEADVQLEHEAIELDLAKRTLKFQNGRVEEFTNLISSLPLPELVRITKAVPMEVAQLANQLEWTSVQLVSLGFGEPQRSRHLWDYYYDEEFFPARSYSPSLKSPKNAPAGCSSLQFEIYANSKRESLLSRNAVLENVLNYGREHELFDTERLKVVDVRTLEYGNVIFLNGMEAARNPIREYYRRHGVATVGRFGEWDYLWSDQSLMSGCSAVAALG